MNRNAQIYVAGHRDGISPSRPRCASPLRSSTFRNLPGPGVGGMAVAVAPSRGTPSQFVVEYTLWVGDPAKPYSVDNSGAVVADVASRLLLEVRAQCAPAAPGTPTCSLMPNFGQDGQKTRTGRCSTSI